MSAVLDDAPRLAGSAINGVQPGAQFQDIGGSIPGGGGVFADLYRDAAMGVHRDKSGFVGRIVARKNGFSAFERTLFKEAGDDAALVIAKQPDLANHLADDHVQVRPVASDFASKSMASLFEIGPQPEVDGHSAGFAFDDDARLGNKGGFNASRDAFDNILVDQRGMKAAGGVAALQAVDAGDGQNERIKQPVDNVDISPDTSASARPTLSRNFSRKCSVAGSMRTSSGRSSISTSVPSKSRKMQYWLRSSM